MQASQALSADCCIVGEGPANLMLGYLPVRCRFIAFMPRWDFLNFLAAEAEKYPGFTLLQSTGLDDFLYQNGTVVWIRPYKATSFTPLW